MSILKTKNLSYKSILNNINIEFVDNKINLISGSNKSGKTTLIKILRGIIGSKNQVFLNGKDISILGSYELISNMGMVSTINDNDFNFPTINEELKHRLDRIDEDSEVLNNRYKGLIELFDLGNYLTKKTKDIKKVIKIKALIIKELLSKPNVLILDSIFDEIDSNISIDILNKLKSIDGLTVIVSSNSLKLATVVDTIYILHKGKLILSGDAKDVLKEDSTLNKIGLELPFMVDLSLKLKYYNLMDNIELDMDRMIDNLWK